MKSFAEQMMVTCVALRLVKDWVTDSIPLDENVLFESICADINKDFPQDNIYKDQTIAVALFLVEHFDEQGYPDGDYIQVITDIIANNHNSTHQKKKVY